MGLPGNGAGCTGLGREDVQDPVWGMMDLRWSSVGIDVVSGNDDRRLWCS